MRRSPRPRNYSERPVPRYGEKGMVAVELKIELPYEYRGEYTQHNYVWPEHWPPGWAKWVDRRDVPGLVKKVGLDNLEGDAIEEIRTKKAEKKRKKKIEQQKAPPKPPEAEKADDNGGGE